jgi:hypothetical protein
MGCLEDRNALTSDGRNIGILTGAWIDLNIWTSASLIVEIKKNAMDMLKVKKSILRTARANIPASYIALL